MALRERHIFRLRWYHSSSCLEKAIIYYQALRKVLKTCPDLRKLLCRCRHCLVYFLTKPCNQGRTDLGCPFGCAEGHRQSSSNSRSKDYYNTPEGKEKKKVINKKRSLDQDVKTKNESKIEFELNIFKSKSIWKFISYLRFIMIQIENIKVSIDEVWNIYQVNLKKVRQHSLELCEKIIEDPDG